METTKTTRCWCGGRRLEPFGKGFLECRECGTLARAEMPAGDVTRVRDEERDLYGREYWFSHQAELGQADLALRSAADLPERCLHWLAAILRFKPPPGRALELGAAHGGMTALLGWSGYDATGLELSPWVAEWARRAFGVPMLEGPLEDQDLEPGSFDVVLAMDVLEHLPDPLGTMTRAAALLKDDGVLVVQTPCRPSGLSLAELESAGHRFPEMLLAEHLFLLTESAVAELLRRSGLPEVVFEPAFFAHYDMFLAAGRRRPERAGGELVRRRLLARPPSRLVAALLDVRAEAEGSRGKADELAAAFRRADDDRTALQRQVEELRTAFRQADEDRTERQRQVEELRTAFRQADEDRTERQRQVEELQSAFRQADEDRTERQRQVEELQSAFCQADEDRTERQRQVEELRTAFRQADEDRTERQRQVEELRTAFRQADEDRTERQRQVEELQSAFRRADEDRTERQRRIEELEARLDRERTEKDRREALLREEIDGLREEVRTLHLEVERRAHREEELETLLERRRKELEEADAGLREQRLRAEELEGRLAGLGELHERLRALAADHRHSRLYRAMVRLGRWLDHDRRLVEVLAAEPSRKDAAAPSTPTPEVSWTLETRDAPRRNGPVAIDLTSLLPGGENGGAKLVATGLARALPLLAPERDFVLLTTEPCHEELAALEGANVRRQRVDAGPAGLARLLAADPFALTFCPMTAAPWNDPRSPVVSVIHDLQYLTYPGFFSAAERAERDRSFRRAVRWSEKIVTVSGYVRDRVIEHGGLDGDRVVAIPNSLSDRLPELEIAEVEAVLSRHGLERGRYFLYPANFWPHKNHRMLLVALGQLRRGGAADGLKLVFTGSDRPDPGPVAEAVRRMELGEAVHLAGWLPERDLAALVDGCRAVVFPSLYEGFGMPVVEAMARGRPVACSGVTALPEVAGGAALLFDPRKPAEIADAMRRLSSDALAESLGRRGRERARELGDSEAMARAYLRLLEETLAARPCYRDRVVGVFGDRWTPGRFVVSHGAGAGRELELGFDNPRDEAVTVAAGGRQATLEPRRSLCVTCRLPDEPGCLELRVAPTFRPSDSGRSVDTRDLGLMLSACRISGGADLLAGPAR